MLLSIDIELTHLIPPLLEQGRLGGVECMPYLYSNQKLKLIRRKTLRANKLLPPPAPPILGGE